MSGEVFTVVVLRGIESVQRHNLRHDGFFPEVSFIEFSDERFSDGSLPVVVIEDGGTVLRAHVLALPVQCGRVVDGEENLQDFPIRNLVRIESQLDRLGVTRGVGADSLVGRIDGGTAGVAGSHILNPIHFFEDGLQTPEAAAGKGGDFCSGPLGHSLFSGLNFRAMPSMQYRLPVGSGPSSKT